MIFRFTRHPGWMPPRSGGMAFPLPRWTAGANHGFGRTAVYLSIRRCPGCWAQPQLSSSVDLRAGGIHRFDANAGGACRRLRWVAACSRQSSALFCAACFAANPYALLIVYMRSDFAEQLAMVFFPADSCRTCELRAWCKVRFRTADAARRVSGRCFCRGVADQRSRCGYRQLWSCAVLFSFGHHFRANPGSHCCAGLAALALGLGLAGFYLVPAIYEQSWVNITQALASGLQPSQNFLYAVIADVEHNAFNRIASNTAVLMIVVDGIFAAVAFLQKQETRSHVLSKASLERTARPCHISAFLMLRVSGIFWISAAQIAFCAISVALDVHSGDSVCMFFRGSDHDAKKLRWYWAHRPRPHWRCCWQSRPRWMVRHTLVGHRRYSRCCWKPSRTIEGFEGVDEYDPVGDDHSSLPEKSPRMKLLHARQHRAWCHGARIHVERWSAEQERNAHHRARAVSPGAATIELSRVASGSE